MTKMKKKRSKNLNLWVRNKVNSKLDQCPKYFKYNFKFCIDLSNFWKSFSHEIDSKIETKFWKVFRFFSKTSSKCLILNYFGWWPAKISTDWGTVCNYSYIFHGEIKKFVQFFGIRKNKNLWMLVKNVSKNPLPNFHHFFHISFKNWDISEN